MLWTKTKSQFFSDYIPNPNKKDRFVGWTYLENSDKTHAFLEQTKITKKAAMACEGAMEIVYKKDKAIKYRLIEEGEFDDFEDLSSSDLKYLDYPLNNYQRIEFEDKGIHQIGGSPNADLIYPKSIGKSPFIYLGQLSGSDDCLKWMGLDVFDIIFPLYSDLDIIYLDYSNQQKIIQLDECITHKIEEQNEAVNENTILTYESKNFNFVSANLKQLGFDNFGNTGSPHWLQGQIIPTCPVSHDKMKFLFQFKFEAYTKISISKTNIQDNEVVNNLKDMSGIGYNIYIFIHPKTKIAAMYWQMT